MLEQRRMTPSSGTVCAGEDETPSTARGLGLLVGASAPMRSLYETLAIVGRSAASVLVVGESGTGKELVARTLHELSDRRAKRFIGLNCAAVPETLMESELFGHEKGAFTGATSYKPGCFDLAHGGTLFLDELSAMPLASQVKLLRVLEERCFRRLGGARELSVDVRVVAATNQSAEDLVQQKKLRPDLLFRLNVFTLQLPPLRERVEDIPLLVEHFIEQFNEANDKSLVDIEPDALAQLLAYRWPGNVRELRNVVEHAVIVEEERRLSLGSLLPSIRKAGTGGVSARDASEERERVPSSDEPIAAVGMTVDEVSRRLILETLAATDYNRTRAAALLGISSRTIYNKLRRWNVESAV